MNKNICEKCPCYPPEEIKEASIPNKDFPVLFVIDKPLQKKVYNWFIKILANVFNVKNYDIKNKFNFTYAIRCNTEDQKNKKIQQGCCKKYLMHEIKEIKPKLIILFGKDAMATIFPKNSRVESKRGRLFSEKLSIVYNKKKETEEFQIDEAGDQYTFLTSYSPDYVFNNIVVLKQFITDMILAYKYLYKQLKKTAIKYEKITTDIQIKDMLKFIKLHKKAFNFVCCDLETTGLNSLEDTVVFLGLTFSNLEKNIFHNYVIDIHEYQNISGNTIFNKNNLGNVIFDFIYKQGIKTIGGANFKFDLKFLYGLGFPKYNNFMIFDILLIEYLLDNEKYGKKAMLSLEDLLSDYYPEAVEYKKIKIKKKDINKDSILANKDYWEIRNANDIYYTAKIVQSLYKKIREKENLKLWKIYKYIYSDLTQILAQMEYRGVKIDVKELLRLKADYEKKIKSLVLKIKKIIYKDTKNLVYTKSINIDSPAQMKVLFFERWKLPILSKTKKGSPQLRKDDYAKYLYKHNTGKINLSYIVVKFLNLLKEYKLTKHRYSLFIVGILKNLDKQGRIHTEYRMTGTDTGRLSSANINLQNIPRDTTDAFIKMLFTVTNKHYKLLDMDLSQIELRVMAIIANVSKLIEAYEKKQDIHLKTAAGMKDDSYEKAMRQYKENPDSWKQIRFDAKKVNFGIQYCMEARTLAVALSDFEAGRVVSEKEAQAYIDSYFKTYPEVKQYMTDQEIFVTENGFVQNLFGRKRHLSNIYSANSYIRESVIRQAVNTPIQSTAGDIMFLFIVLIYKLAAKHNVKTHFLLTVYDSLLAESKTPKKVEKIYKLALKKLIQVSKEIFGVEYSVPIEYSLDTGTHWGKHE